MPFVSVVLCLCHVSATTVYVITASLLMIFSLKLPSPLPFSLSPYLFHCYHFLVSTHEFYLLRPSYFSVIVPCLFCLHFPTYMPITILYICFHFRFYHISNTPLSWFRSFLYHVSAVPLKTYLDMAHLALQPASFSWNLSVSDLLYILWIWFICSAPIWSFLYAFSSLFSPSATLFLLCSNIFLHSTQILSTPILFLYNVPPNFSPLDSTSLPLDMLVPIR